MRVAGVLLLHVSRRRDRGGTTALLLSRPPAESTGVGRAVAVRASVWNQKGQNGLAQRAVRWPRQAAHPCAAGTVTHGVSPANARTRSALAFPTATPVAWSAPQSASDKMAGRQESATLEW